MTRTGPANRHLIAAVLRGTSVVYGPISAGVAVALPVALPGDHAAGTGKFRGARAWPVVYVIFHMLAALAACATFLAALLDTAHAPQGGAPVSSGTPGRIVAGPAACLLGFLLDVHPCEYVSVRFCQPSKPMAQVNFNEES